MSPSPFHGIFSALGQSPLKEPLAPLPFGKDMPASPHEERSTAGRVAVDIYEHDDYYIVKAPIAGVRLSDIDIEVTENVLTIRGRRQQGDTVADDQFYLRECFWGEFSRSITFPGSIDPKKVKATLDKANVLKVLVPKEEKVKVIRINE